MLRLSRQLIATAFAGTCLLSSEFANSAPEELPSCAPDYVIDCWQSDDGLPQNSVISMAQTSDGYLWMSTFDGLARFDGRRFDVFDGDVVPELAGDLFANVRADANGNLWMRGERQRIVVGRNGRFRQLGEADGVSPRGVVGMELGPDGTPWASDKQGRLLKYDDHRFVVFKDAPPTPTWGNMTFLQIERSGVVWTWTLGNCARLADGKWTVVLGNGTDSPVATVRPSRDGSRVWLTQLKTDRLLEYVDGHLNDIGPIPAGFGVYFIEEDDAGNLWLPGPTGVLRREPDGRWSSLAPRDGFPTDRVRSELLDREGNLWFGTDGGGVVRVKRRAAQSLGLAQGLTGKVVLSVGAETGNSAWVATLGGGLDYFDGVRFSRVAVPPGMTGDLSWCVCPVAGGVWVGSYNEGLYFVNAARTRLEHFDKSHNPEMIGGPVLTSFAASNGDLWIGGTDGLTRYAQGRFQTWTAASGLADNLVNTIAEDRAGAIWIGTAGGLNRFDSNQLTNVPLRGAVAGNDVHTLFCDSQGDLWIGGHDLTRMRTGQLRTIRSVDGLPINDLRAIIEDDLGFLWISTAHGILRASRKDLDDFCDTGKGAVAFAVFTREEGLPSNECSKYESAAAKGTDGRLWFPTLNGVAVIDPKRIPTNTLAPPVAIQSVTADDQPVDMTADPAPGGAPTVRVPPGAARLEFHFVALSFTAPEKNQYSFRLERLDQHWSRSAPAQVAAYTHLPPGQYQFHVRGCNNDGVWNDAGALLAVNVLPFFWQTKWFYALVSLAAALLIYGAFRARLAQVERRRLEQELFARKLIETQEAERQRIARELHDGVGQTLLLAKNHLSMGMGKAPPAASAVEALGQASAEVSQAIEEVRSTARTLRPVELDRLGLSKALESMLDRIRGTTTIRISSELDDLGQWHARDMEIQLYRIAQEAMNNVVKHSKAGGVIVELKREDGNLRLTVQDDGLGFNSEGSDHKGGFGLSGITERARLIGGTLSIKAAPGKGCRLTVVVPLLHEHRQ